MVPRACAQYVRGPRSFGVGVWAHDIVSVWLLIRSRGATCSWIEYEDVPLGASYTLAHTVLMSCGRTLFGPEMRTELRAIQGPPELLPPRYSWRFMADKMMFTLRNTTAGWREYENASMTNGRAEPFGFYAKTWYAIAGKSFGIPTYEDIEHSPGASAPLARSPPLRSPWHTTRSNPPFTSLPGMS